MLDLSHMIPDMKTKNQQVVHYKGKEQQTTLPRFAGAVRNTILQAELMQDYDKVRKGLDWFRKHFAPQYMVLLD